MFLDNLSPDVALLLTNVLYFKNGWTFPFEDPAPSQKGLEFTKLDGSKARNVAWMTRSTKEFKAEEDVTFDGLPGKKFVAVSIPYEVSEE